MFNGFYQGSSKQAKLCHGGNWIFTSGVHHAALQNLLHPDGHVGDVLGDSLDPLHQASWLKPAKTNRLKPRKQWLLTLVVTDFSHLKQLCYSFF